MDAAAPGSWIDTVMAFVASPYLAVAVGVGVLAFALWKRSLRVLTLFLIGLTAVEVTNILEADLVRPFFASLRRCGEAGAACPGEQGLPSNHAAQAMAVAAVIMWAGRRLSIRAFAGLAALAIGFSRIYLGIHDVADIATAFVIGSVVGTTLYALLAPPKDAPTI